MAIGLGYTIVENTRAMKCRFAFGSIARRYAASRLLNMCLMSDENVG
jgi:hypothetical protein